MKQSLNNQQVGNVGLYYSCLLLTQHGWLAFPTVRNAKGADIYAIHPESPEKAIPIQVKTISKETPVPMGNWKNRTEKYLFVVVGIENPKLYFTQTRDILDKVIERNVKNGKTSYWLSKKHWKQFHQDLAEFP